MSGFYPPVFVNIQKSRSCLCDWKVKDFNESEVWRNPRIRKPKKKKKQGLWCMCLRVLLRIT